MTNKIIYIDMDGVVADFATKWETMYGCKLDPYHLPPTPDRFYHDLEPIPDAIESVHKLSTQFNIYFLSTPEWDNPSCWMDKRLWIEKHFGDLGYKKLILSHDKSLCIGDYLIDDRIVHGVDNFIGEHIHFGTEQFPDWETVLKYLLQKEGIHKL
jgi:5'(3')-deoxyribonucleotidase